MCVKEIPIKTEGTEIEGHKKLLWIRYKYSFMIITKCIYNFSKEKLSSKLTKTCNFNLAILIYANKKGVSNQFEKSLTVDRTQQEKRTVYPHIMNIFNWIICI